MPDAEAPTATSPAHDDWDRHWDELASASELNPAVGYRARLLALLLSGDGTPARLLDIGVGSGDFLAHAAGLWPSTELAGVDVSESGVRVAARRVPRARLEVADLTSEWSPTLDLEAWATQAVCSEVLEHLDDPLALLRNSATMLAPGALLVVTVPSGRMSAFDRHIGHRRHYTPELLRSQLAATGYRQIEVMRAGFPFFNVYRAVVRARGEALIEDVSAEHADPSGPARLAMAAFRALFRLNLTRSPWGLQLVALARRAG
jgi:SAM-dependent methyltransferase